LANKVKENNITIEMGMSMSISSWVSKAIDSVIALQALHAVILNKPCLEKFLTNMSTFQIYTLLTSVNHLKNNDND